MSAIVTTAELKTAFNCKRIGDLEKCLRQNNIPFLYGRNGSLFTTIDALNKALGLETGKITKKDEPIEII